MQTLSDRMKDMEQEYALTVPRDHYLIMRLDGRAFHTYTKGMRRPYDMKFMYAMNCAARELYEQLDGSVLGFIQSDEITLVARPTTENGEHWFGGKVQKVASVGASIASDTFKTNINRLDTNKPVNFDARVFSTDSPRDVALNLIWRQDDCIRNSVQSAAQTYFTSKELHGANIGQQKEKLASVGQNWEDLPAGFKYGRVIWTQPGYKEIPSQVVCASAYRFAGNSFINRQLGLPDHIENEE